jgi:hypothetical protein
MKIVQCPEWCKDSSNPDRQDFYFVIKTEENGYTYKNIYESSGHIKFHTNNELDILTEKDITILDNIAED